jgi:ribosomal peptide maturation radical SAM protein 1
MSLSVVLVVPPWAGLDRPAIGVHVLQAVGAAAGHRVRVAYANIAFAARMGERDYHAICYAPTGALVGEQLFSEAAFQNRIGLNGRSPAIYRRISWPDDPTVDAARLAVIQADTLDFVRAFARDLINLYSPDVVGCSTTFEQTTASLALLREIRRIAPRVTTILGGANCDGEMAQAISDIAPWIDRVFSGESERTFGTFLTETESAEGGRPARVVAGAPCRSLDDLPPLNFDDYFQTLDTTLKGTLIRRRDEVWLTYETSRGCWWGQKQHCTFCGLNGTGMAFRKKSVQRVLDDLTALVTRYGTKNVCMVDNIMPWDYFRDLLPLLPAALPDVNIFYEQKANLTLAHCSLLAAAGIRLIQPGIEALNTDLLRLMRKGVSAPQNVRLLRYARATGVTLNWNLLYGFPGDLAEWYAATTDLLPLLEHLCPPGGCYRLSIDRFSPYFDRPDEFGLHALQPLPAYGEIFPAGTRLGALAYHFVARYPSGSLETPQIIDRCESLVSKWLSCWRTADAAPPVLALEKVTNDVYVLLDTRSTRVGAEISFIEHEQAVAVVGGGSLLQGAWRHWALENSYAVILDGQPVPLVVADPPLFARLEECAKRPMTSTSRGSRPNESLRREIGSRDVAAHVSGRTCA